MALLPQAVRVGQSVVDAAGVRGVVLKKNGKSIRVEFGGAKPRWLPCQDLFPGSGCDGGELVAQTSEGVPPSKSALEATIAAQHHPQEQAQPEPEPAPTPASQEPEPELEPEPEPEPAPELELETETKTEPEPEPEPSIALQDKQVDFMSVLAEQGLNSLSGHVQSHTNTSTAQPSLPAAPALESPLSEEPAPGSQLHVRGIGVLGWDGTPDGKGEYESEEALALLFGHYGGYVQATVRHRIDTATGQNTRCVILLRSVHKVRTEWRTRSHSCAGLLRCGGAAWQLGTRDYGR